MSSRKPAGMETIEIRTSDGWSLRADVHDPGQTPVGVAVLAHAMMARRTEFDRPRAAGLSAMLVDRGWRVVAFDFRGHGDSGPTPSEGGTYGYDDFVSRDMPAVCAFARARAGRKKPVVVVGHSLGGHVALAAQGTGAIRVDGVVGVAASVWLPTLEPSRALWALKRATMMALGGVSRRLGHFPARWLRLGSDDAALACVEDFERFAQTGRWTSRDGRLDYLASLANVRVPVLQVVSEGDRFECVPGSGERFVAACAGPHQTIRVARRDDGGHPPRHMALVTGGGVRSVWERVEVWMRGVARPG